MRIAYLTSRYPAVSHTFILREVQALRACGVEVITFSVRRAGAEDTLGPDARQEAASTRWLVPPPGGELLRAVAWAWVTKPVLSARTLARAVLKRGTTLAQRLKWLCYFGEAMLLAHRLTKQRCDHLHCHFGNSGSSTALLAAQLARIPFSLTCHGSELRSIHEYRLPEKVAQASFVACVSQHGKAQLMLACPPRQWPKLHVVRCGVPAMEPAPRDRGSGSAHILCVARLAPEKGHTVLLEALADLRDRRVDFHCTLVGDGPLRPQIEERTRELQLTERMTLTGSLEPKRVAKLYATAHVLVLASLSEGVPVTLMEAMMHGCPVVATRVGGVPELVQDGRSGLVAEPGDPPALADALHRVLINVELADTLARNGNRLVRERFSTDKAASRLQELFTVAINASPADQSCATKCHQTKPRP